MAVARGLTAAVAIVLAACGGEDGDVVVEETFGPPDHSWSVEDSASATYEYADEAYRMVAKQSGRVFYSLLPSDPSFTALSVEADMTLKASSSEADTWGVACLSGSRLGYLFTVFPDGRAAITKARDLSAAEIELVESGRSAAIRGPDETNRVRGECTAADDGPTRLALVVNGERVIEAEDAGGLDDFDTVGFAIYTRNGGTEVLFDNLVVREH